MTHVASHFAVPQVIVSLPLFIHYLKFKGSFDLIGLGENTSPVSRPWFI